MTRMTPELDRLAAARPETARPAAALTDEGQRRRLLAAIMADEQPQRSRQRHRRWLMPAAAAAASALAVSRRHRQIAFAAVAVTVTAGAALAVTALTPAGQQASHQPTVQLAAWTVSKLADGNISITINQFKDPSGLQSTLRADGVPASVTFANINQLNPACHPYPGGTLPPGFGPPPPLLKRVFPKPYQVLRSWSPRPARSVKATGSNTVPLSGNSVAVVIDPSALPRDAGVQLASSDAAATEALMLPQVVYASAQCTGG
jgi:hypothetical protein